MKHVCFDTEFYDYGDIIELISIGCVSETGEEFYAENKDFSLDYHDLNGDTRWLKKHVIPKLKPFEERLHTRDIREQLLLWIHGLDGEVKFWAWYGSYDWVLLCKLYGGMFNLPVQLHNRVGELADLPLTNIPKGDEAFAHHALTDARWNMELWKLNFIREYGL